MADIIFVFYIILMIVVCVGAFTPGGIDLQREYLAFRDTKRYMNSKGLPWPPRRYW